ncbi:hypothetical protein FRC03_009374 [Tulasnella sp. 419]|nr:hypothetical protein FRC03_009374 [Tulasnella sp. 419]
MFVLKCLPCLFYSQADRTVPSKTFYKMPLEAFFCAMQPGSHSSYFSNSTHPDNIEAQDNRFLVWRRAYSPPPLPDADDMRHIVKDQSEPAHVDAKATSSPVETTVTDQTGEAPLNANPDFKEYYGSSTDESDLRPRPYRRASSPSDSVYSFHSSVDNYLVGAFAKLETNYRLYKSFVTSKEGSSMHSILFIVYQRIWKSMSV